VKILARESCVWGGGKNKKRNYKQKVEISVRESCVYVGGG
jgi:hypothetical protein